MPDDPKEPKQERRFSATGRAPIDVEQRQGEEPVITGFAAVYYDGTRDTEYELFPGYRERIQAGAFSTVLKEDPDTRALYNHDPDNVLGRTTNGTLRLKSTRKGLHFDIDPPDTQLGRDVTELIRRGDVTGSSFAFTVGDEKTVEEDGEVIRVIKKVAQLFDVGPVTYPAYDKTLADLRSIESRSDVAAKDEARRQRLQAMLDALEE